MSLIHALVVTFERPDELAATLEAIGRQTRQPDTLTIVDNARPGRTAISPSEFPDAVVIATGENLGPAGGLARGLSAILATASLDDRVLFVDDDDPPLSDQTIEQLEHFASEISELDEAVAAVGVSGARFDRRTGRLIRVADMHLRGEVDVDFIAGGQFPLYRVDALRKVGGPRPEFFFGFEELDLGLRLQNSGYRLMVDGDRWKAVRASLGRLGLSPSAAAASRGAAGWRRYYSTRNFIYVARCHGRLAASLLATLRFGLVRPVVDSWRARSIGAAGPSVRGARDAWLGRMGRTVEP